MRNFALVRKTFAIWRRAAKCMIHGDYYPHIHFHRDPHNWAARQFDSPGTGCGLPQAIRLPAAPEESLTILPHGIDRDAHYLFENVESGETLDVLGDSLLHARFTFTLPARNGAIWFYSSRS